MKIYGKKVFIAHLAFYLVLISIGVFYILRRELGALSFIVVGGIGACRDLPKHFDVERYEKYRRRENCVKEIMQERFGKFASLIIWSPLILAGAALVIFIIFPKTASIVPAVVLLLVACVVIILNERYVKKRLPGEYSE